VNSNSIVSLLPIILIILVFYLFIIRPNQNRQRAAAQMRDALAPGAEVKTIGGLFATVSAVEDDVLVLQIAPDVYCRFDKRAVANVVTPAGESDAQAPTITAAPMTMPTGQDAEEGTHEEAEGTAEGGSTETTAKDGGVESGDADGATKPKSE
jgi:preprotein translocase subunit YajC